VATSGATLFRSIGGSLGTAILGAIFTGRLTAELADRVPRGAGGGTEGGVNPAQIDRLPEPLHSAYIASFTDAIQVVFLVATAVVLVAFVLSWLIPERPLRATVTDGAGVGESFAAPVFTDSLREITRGLARQVGRDRSLAVVERAVDRAGVDELTPSAAWLLMRARAPDAPEDVVELRTLPMVVPERFDRALAELREHGYVDGARITQAGEDVRDRLVMSTISCLRDLVDDWEPGHDPELDERLAQLAEELPHPEAEVPAGSASA
jgi:hypothetical protein